MTDTDTWISLRVVAIRLLGTCLMCLCAISVVVGTTGSPRLWNIYCCFRLCERRRAVHSLVPEGKVHWRRGADLHRRDHPGPGTSAQGRRAATQEAKWSAVRCGILLSQTTRVNSVNLHFLSILFEKRISLFLVITLRVVVISYRRFGKLPLLAA